MKLEQIHQEGEEILAKEKDLKVIAQYVLDIDGFISLEEGRMGSAEGFNMKREWVRTKLASLKQKVNLDTTRLDKYQKLFAEFDSYADDASRADSPKYKEARKKCTEISNEIDRLMKQDIENERNKS
ncbi:MAG: hypothetical protein HQL12_09140 [Candidatus Omnitrophica bacterium]|nr:hypothetical protein [Candidatus Omnitrophota bacterium]